MSASATQGGHNKFKRKENMCKLKTLYRIQKPCGCTIHEYNGECGYGFRRAHLRPVHIHIVATELKWNELACSIQLGYVAAMCKGLYICWTADGLFTLPVNSWSCLTPVSLWGDFSSLLLPTTSVVHVKQLAWCVCVCPENNFWSKRHPAC